MEDKINYQKIIDDKVDSWDAENDEIIECMKESIRQAIPIILKEASDKAMTGAELPDEFSDIDKNSILSLEKSLRTMLGV